MLTVFSVLYSISLYCLFVYYIHSSIYLLIHFPNLATTPSLSLLVTTSFFISMSLFLFCYIQSFVLFFLVPHINDNIHINTYILGGSTYNDNIHNK